MNIKKPSLKTTIKLAISSSLLLALPTFSAFAAITTTSFQVTANVLATCAVTATDLVFGNYTGAEIDTTNNVGVTCTNTTNYNVSLSAGDSGSYFPRKMDNILEYNIFVDSNRTQIWGDLTGGTSQGSGTGNGTQQNFPGYGRLFLGQFVTPQNYNDTITVTVDFT